MFRTEPCPAPDVFEPMVWYAAPEPTIPVEPRISAGDAERIDVQLPERAQASIIHLEPHDPQGNGDLRRAKD